MDLMDNIWGADLADTEVISKFNKGIRFNKKGITITNAFQKNLR